MNLNKVIKEIEQLNCKVITLKNLNSKGRYILVNNQHFIFLRSDTSDIEKINVLLHEKHHLINDDCNNSLSQIDTFKRHIENNSEKGRILDFMSLVNSEYPIDEHFNYQDYLKNAEIPASYENYVKEIATNFYNENKKITLSNDSVIFYFRTFFKLQVAYFDLKNELNIQEYVIFLRFLLQNNISPKFIITSYFYFII